MEISKEITVKISVPELEQLIIDHLKNKNINADHVIFSINPHNIEGDWRSEFASRYTLDEVICKGKTE